jgi:acetyltransferase-like isoleucine patch superfamily enzyme
MLAKGICLLRGTVCAIRFKHSSFPVFAGRNVRIRFPERITSGACFNLEDNVVINALCKTGIKFGKNVSLRSGTIIDCTGVIRELGEGLVVGDYVGISEGCFIQVRGSVVIGSYVMMGPNVSVFSENHGTSNPDIRLIDEKNIRKGVTIEDNVWIGSSAIILDGVTVGQGSIIAAGCVVTRDVPPFTIVAGVPGNVIKERKSHVSNEE